MSVMPFALEGFEMKPFISSSGRSRNIYRRGAGAGRHRHPRSARHHAARRRLRPSPHRPRHDRGAPRPARYTEQTGHARLQHLLGRRAPASAKSSPCWRSTRRVPSSTICATWRNMNMRRTAAWGWEHRILNVSHVGEAILASLPGSIACMAPLLLTVNHHTALDAFSHDYVSRGVALSLPPSNCGLCAVTV